MLNRLTNLIHGREVMKWRTRCAIAEVSADKWWDMYTKGVRDLAESRKRIGELKSSIDGTAGGGNWKRREGGPTPTVGWTWRMGHNDQRPHVDDRGGGRGVAAQRRTVPDKSHSRWRW